MEINESTKSWLFNWNKTKNKTQKNICIFHGIYWLSWQHHDMETLSTLLALSTENQPLMVFHHKGAVIQSLDVFFLLSLNSSTTNSWCASDLKCPDAHVDRLVQKDVTPLLAPCSYIFLALSHRCDVTQKVFYFNFIIPQHNEVVGGYTGFTLSVRPSVCPSVRPTSPVRSVAPTVLVGSISNLYISSRNFRRCVVCKVFCKISKFVFLAIFLNL